MMNYFEKLQKKVNKYRAQYYLKPRKVAFRLFWWNFICLFRFFNKNEELNILDQNKIAIALNGGIGDYLTGINYSLYLFNYLDKSTPIDIFIKNPKDFEKFVRDSVPFNFYDRDFIHSVKGYAVKINLNRFPQILYYNEKIINNQLPKFKRILQASLQLYKDASMYFDLDPKADALTVQYAKINGAKKRIQQPDLDKILNIRENYLLSLKPNNNAYLSKFGLSGKSFITLNRGTDAGNSFNEVTRMWPLEYYNELVKKIKLHFPNYLIVQLGYSKDWCKEIKGVDIDLRGKTTLSDLRDILYYSSLHIDYEGGMVHLRKVLNTGKSIVLFGPTDPNWLGYKNNINICTYKCNFCENLNSKCQKICSNHKYPNICMKSITPEMVYVEVEKYLNNLNVRK